MHPAQARGRQMNYNISFSRPYIPTDRAYWRGLIAFNSLLVHPCNGPGPRETHSRRYDRCSVFLFLPSIPELPFCPLRAFPPPSPPSIRRHRLVVEIIIALFLSFFFLLQRRDRLTLMQPPIVRGDRREEVLGSQPAAGLPRT